MHRHQDAGVGRDDDAAGQDVAEDEERQSVGARRRVLIGQAPVDATGGAVRFRSVLAPVGQRWAGKQQRIEPSTGDEQTAMNGAKPVPCGKKKSKFYWYYYYDDANICIGYFIPTFRILILKLRLWQFENSGWTHLLAGAK